MAGWPIVKDDSGSGLKDVENLDNGLCFDLDSPVRVGDLDDCKEKYRNLFDQLLSTLSKEEKCVRPLPAFLGDGNSVDLFKLFFEVRKRGGFVSVSEDGLWPCVAEECGFDVGFMASIKLIYMKYLDGLDNRFSSIFGDKGLEKIESKDKKIVEKCCVNFEDDFVYSDAGATDGELDSRKRKRESPSLWGLLNWLVLVARSSDDPSVKNLPECSNEELWAQALSARDALVVKRHEDSSIKDFLLQKKIKMHPLMYEEDGYVLNSHQSIEGPRCSKRVPSATKPLVLGPCCNTDSVDKQTKAEIPPCKGKEKEVLVTSVEKLTTDTEEDPLRKHVSVGPLFQADVPPWTGVVSESDSKWLGTRVWPVEEDFKLDSSFVETGLIGKGRRDNPCECRVRGSVECVRFHIAEKRLKLKRELGLAFYRWRFHRMGEEVSLSWTIKEENKFKDMVKLYSESRRFFVGRSKLFRTRKLVDLVSYYFNVYVVQRRSYQNRVTPRNVDSDDDEAECGRVGDSFGFAALRISGAEPLVCIENKQCTEFE